MDFSFLFIKVYVYSQLKNDGEVTREVPFIKEIAGMTPEPITSKLDHLVKNS